MGLFSAIGSVVGSVFGGPSGGSIGGAIGGLIDGKQSGKAARSAASAANAAAQQDIDLRRRMYEEGVARQKPFYEAGVNALPQYVSGIAPGGELVRGFTLADYTADPGYGFRLAEGMKALDRQAAARGGLISGAALRGAQRYGQELGSQEFQNAYARFRETQGLRRNALAGIAGYGPTAAGQMASYGQQYASGAGPQMYQQGVNVGNALISAQQSRESAYGQLGSALGKYVSGGGNFGFGMQDPLTKFLSGTSGSGD